MKRQQNSEVQMIRLHKIREIVLEKFQMRIAMTTLQRVIKKLFLKKKPKMEVSLRDECLEADNAFASNS